MKFLIINLIALVLTTQAVASEVTKFKVNSKLSKQELDVRLYLPQSYDEETAKHYPILLTTAGKSREKVLVEQVNWLSHVNFAPMPEVIQVVLPYIELDGLSDRFDKASGNENKLVAEVLVKELLPAIDKKYRTSGYRVVEGFSTFGNIPLYLLRHYSSAFNAFFMFSPALELDKSGLVSSFSDDWSLSPNRHHFVYLSLGTFRKNKPLYRKLTESLLAKQNEQSFDFIHTDLSAENYLSGPNLGLIQASQSLFADLQPDYKQFHLTGIKGVKEYFTLLSEKYFEQIDLNEKLVSLGFSYAAEGEFERAIETMKHVVTEDESKVLFRVRLAQVQIQAKRHEAALETLADAQKLARKSNDDEALNYITRMKQDISE